MAGEADATPLAGAMSSGQHGSIRSRPIGANLASSGSHGLPPMDIDLLAIYGAHAVAGALALSAGYLSLEPKRLENHRRNIAASGTSVVCYVLLSSPRVWFAFGAGGAIVIALAALFAMIGGGFAAPIEAFVAWKRAGSDAEAARNASQRLKWACWIGAASLGLAAFSVVRIVVGLAGIKG